MEINKYNDIIGGITLADVAEGRMVVLAAPPTGTDDGVYGVRIPASSAEAARARYVVAWPPTNFEAPYVRSWPQVSWALRSYFDQDANSPASVTMSYTYEGDRENSTVPSGYLVRVFGPGAVFTLTSGHFVDSESLDVGAPLSVEYSGNDAGKPKYDAAGTTLIVEDYDSTNLLLTVRILD